MTGREAPATVMSVLQAAEGWFADKQIDAPRRSAELLLGSVLGLDRLNLYLEHERPLTAEERQAMRELTARRGRGEPVAHLLGSWSFRGHELAVSPAVLIPRPETEELVSLALERLPEAARVVDLGTGSGAIAIALALERPDVQVTATDASAAALSVAQRNVERHGLDDRVTLCVGNWWQACAELGPFEMVVSNPPYIDPQRSEGLDDEVRAHEPSQALFSEAGDVVSCYREILSGVAGGLRPGGTLLFETGLGAAEPALELLQAEPELQDCELRDDLAGHARYLLATRRG